MKRTVEEWFKIIKTLRDGFMTNPAKYPQIYTACNYYIKHGISRPLQEILEEYPYILLTAERNVLNGIYTLEMNPFLPFPHGKDLNKIQGTYPLGRINFNYDLAGIDSLDLTKGLFACGAMGSGKTYFYLSLLDKMLRVSPEERGFNIIIVQLSKRDADFFVKRSPRLNILEWKDIRYNIWQCEPWEDIETKMSYSRNIFASVNYFFAASRPLLETAMKRAIDACNKMKIKRHPTFSDLLLELEPAASVDLKLETFKSKEVVEYLTFRFADFINTNKVMNSHEGMSIADFWSKQDVILNLMDQQNDYVYKTLFIDLMMGLQRYHSLKEMRPPRLKTLIVVDECRTLFKASHDNQDLNPDKYLEQFVTTCRASGIGWLCVTQEPQTVSTWLSDNASLFMTFPIAGQALKCIPDYMNLNEEQVKYIFELPSNGTCIVRDRRFRRPYLMQVPPDLEIDEFSRDESKQFSEYCFHEICEELCLYEGDAETDNVMTFEDLTVGEQRILKSLAVNQFQSFTELRDSTKSGNKLEEILSLLLHNDLIEFNIFKGSPGQAPKYCALTEKAQDILKMPEAKRISPRLFLHTMYEEWVCQTLEAKGLKAIKEFTVDDKAAINLKQDDGTNEYVKARIDVYCPNTKTAYEITRDDIRHLRVNVHKCFSDFKDYVSRLVLVCENKQVHDAVKAYLAEHYGDDKRQITDKIILMLVREFKPKSKDAEKES